MSDWKIFTGDRQEPHDELRRKLPPPPKWRQFHDLPKDDFLTNGVLQWLFTYSFTILERLPAATSWSENLAFFCLAYQVLSNSTEVVKADVEYWKKLQELASQNPREQERGEKFFIRTTQDTKSDDKTVIDAVNASLYLRRPLLLTGRPGSGKTSLAYAVAYQLKLGPVLLWSITARSNLLEGLYQYDAIARLQDAQLTAHQNIGKYVRLGPVGTAFLRSPYPRVLLIDEIDKSDINLPNDLLNLFEEGKFEIPELVRLSEQQQEVQIGTKDGLSVSIHAGQIKCCAFPFIIMTSNGERDFPPAFLRRCIRVQMPDPTEEDLKEIVNAYLEKDGIAQKFEELIKEFIDKRDNEEGNLATDQLLNTIYLLNHNADETLKDLLFSPLTSEIDS